MLLVLGLFLPGYLVAALRLQSLLRGMQSDCSFRQALSMTFVGALGDLTVPIFAGGDVVKAVYIARSAKRSAAVASVLADRLIGLLALCLCAVLAAGLQLPLILSDPALRKTVLSLLIVSGCGLVGFVAFLCLPDRADGLLRHYLGAIPGASKFLAVFRLFCHLRKSRHLWVSLLMAVLGHVIWAFGVIFLAYALGIPCPLVPALLILPIVAFCNTVSFAGGIGGGIIALEYLFHDVFSAAPGDGSRLGIMLPIVILLSKSYALPWFALFERWSGQRRTARSAIAP
jgi:hypothetical protein